MVSESGRDGEVGEGGGDDRGMDIEPPERVTDLCSTRWVGVAMRRLAMLLAMAVSSLDRWLRRRGLTSCIHTAGETRALVVGDGDGEGEGEGVRPSKEACGDRTRSA